MTQKERALYSSEKDIARIRRKMGIVFQNFNLFPHKSVLENLMLAPMLVERLDAVQAKERPLVLLEKVGLSDKADNYPFELSGGQQQRCGHSQGTGHGPRILCALMNQPLLLT